METTHPLPDALPASPIDVDQLTERRMPSQTMGAYAPSSMPHVQQQRLECSQNKPQAFSDLVAGPSCLPDQEPAFVVHGNAKFFDTVTAARIVMSDERLKSNISPLEFDALSALDKVSIFQYQMSGNPEGQQHTGVVAQNLLAQLPNTVQRDPATGLLSVKLDMLVAYTLKGVQEAAKALRELDSRQRLGMHMLMQQQSAQNASQESKARGFSPTFIASDSEFDSNMSAADACILDRPNTSTPSDPASLSYSSFTDDSALVQLAELGGNNPGMPIKVASMLQQLGRQATWEAFLEAQTTTVLAKDGKARSRGGAFIALLKKQE